MMNFVPTFVDMTRQYDDVSTAYLHSELPAVTVFMSDALTPYGAGQMTEPCMTVAEISVSDD